MSIQGADIIDHFYLHGKQHGKEEGGLEAQIKLLDGQLAEGVITQTYYDKKVAPLKAKLDELFADEDE